MKDKQTFSYVDEQPVSIERLVELNDIDTDLYDVKNGTISKLANGKFSTRAHFYRKMPIEEYAVLNAIKEIEPLAPITRRSFKDTKAPLLAEMFLTDLHLGKRDINNEDRAYERGQEYIDKAIDTMRFMGSSDALLLVGSDFFNYDTIQETTTNGTDQSAMQDIYSVFQTGCEFYLESVHKIVRSCPKLNHLELILIQGNHDRMMSFYLAKWLEAKLSNTEHVTVDAEPTTRKYRQFGNTMLGFAHGDLVKAKDFAQLAAHENPAMWGDTVYRELHLGHLHSRHEITNLTGCLVRTLPALSAQDRWHEEQGYITQAHASDLLFFDNVGFNSQFEIKVSI